MKIPVVLVAAAFAAALIHTTAAAQGYGWLDTSPVRFFTDGDWEVLRGTARNALDNAADGTTASWKNPETDATGSVTVLNTYEEDGRKCRRTKFFNSAGVRR